MTYASTNYKSAAALKREFAAGVPITIFQPGGIFPAPVNGIVFLEGPHYPQPHKWHLKVEVANGIVTKIFK